MKKYFYIVIIIILTWWAVKPLFNPGYFPMHDDQQIARLYELDQALKGGQFPPRWVSNLGFGYGYPLYNFYPPLVYYLGEVFHITGVSLITSIKIVMLLGFFLASITMFFFVKDLFGSKAGLLAAVFYTYAPYHAVDLYVRGALAEFFSFVMFPLILLTTRRLGKNPNLNNLLLWTLSLSGLILTHNLMVFPFSIFLGIYLLFLLGEQRGKKNIGKTIIFLMTGVLIAFGLTAYFSLPAIFEKKYTLVDDILIRELADFRLHFVYLRQFWNSPWGYGGSLYGLEDGLSFEIGKWHIIMSLIGIVGAIFLLVKRKKFGKELLLFSGLLFLSIYLASFHSSWLWEMIKPLWYLQFPWRFLSITAVFTSVTASIGTISLLKKMQSSFFQHLILLLIIAVIIISNKSYFQPQGYLAVTDKDYTTREDISWRISKTSFEFVPKGIATALSDIETTQVDIKKEEIPKKSYEVAGNIKVKEEKVIPHIKKFSVDGEGGVLTINTYNFPGWEVRIDGEMTAINDDNKFKLITIEVPAGGHIVEAQFKNTPVRTAGNLISLIAWVGLLGFTLRLYKIKRSLKIV